jgi:hypothetical protein
VSAADNLVGSMHKIPLKKMMVYTRVPSFSSTVEEFLTGSGFPHSACDPLEW